MTETNTLSTFLHFGYLPDDSPNQLDFLGNLGRWTDKKMSLSKLQAVELVEEGVRILERALQETVVGDGSKCHVLPLSGGLDSRAVLGGLLENLDSREILTVTYGTPGAWDYEIGRSVAQAAGVRSIPMELSAASWRWDAAEIMGTAREVKKPTWLFDAYVNHHIQKRYGTDCVYWSGFLGEALAGAHLRRDGETWEQAKSSFAQWNRLARSLTLTPTGFSPKDSLPESPWVEPEVLSYGDQLDFGIRQRCLIKHIVVPDGYDCRMPLLHPQWVDFILNVPRCYRERQWLYEEILKTAYPRLFSLPTKTNLGLPLNAPFWQRLVRIGTARARRTGKRILPWVQWGIDPSVNYIDFDRGLRERSDLKAVVYENIQALKERETMNWIDMDGIWQRHQRNQGDYADALMLLASLEMYIVAGKLHLPYET